MKRVRRSLRGHFWKRVITYVLVWCLVMNISVPTLMALESFHMQGGVPVGVNPIAWGDHTIIETQNGAVIDWSYFNTSPTQRVSFEQYDVLGDVVQSNTSAVLNRIHTALPTQFRGHLDANGRVFIVNPAGIVFGSGTSLINVSQLVVSGLDITNFADVATTGALPAFAPHPVEGAGNVQTWGDIRTDSTIIAGKKILNNASIFAQDGYIVLAAGENIFITQAGSNILVDVSFTTSAEDFYGADTTWDVENRSSLNADRGQLVLAAGDTFSRAIRNGAFALARDGGSITARAAKVVNQGRMSGEDNSSTIHLIATEEIHLQDDTSPDPKKGTTIVDVRVGESGNGGTITLECTNVAGTGLVKIDDGHLVSARGGGLGGNGGNVKITADHIEIAGDIDASPQDPAFANGTLTIDPSNITVANGASTGATDTLYEEDIEALSQGDGIGGATNLVVHAGVSITVQDILDDLIDGGRGDIEFHAPTINFLDTVTPDTLSTTTGDIVMVGGAGGINTGHLETGAAGLGQEPGDIHVSTTGGGDVSTRDLTIKGGQTKGDINVKADGELSVGTVAVGAGTPIDNDVLGGNAEATVYLGSGGDMLLNGPVTADAHTTSAGDATAKVQVFPGLNGVTGHVTINEDLLARAESDAGTSYALVEVDTFDAITWGEFADATAIGDSAEVLGVRVTQDDVDAPDEAHVWITGTVPTLDALPDKAVTHMGLPVGGNVLDNDVDPEGDDIDVASYTQPANGTVVVDLETGAFTYTPNEGFVDIDTFEYTATDGVETTAPVTVTIDVTNDPPLPQNDVANTQMNQAVNGNVLANDTDGNSDPLSVVLDGTKPSHGTVVLNVDGTFTYTPDSGYVGDDTFTYDATDGQLDGTGNPVVVSATVTVHVTELPPTPSASPVAPGLERRDIEYSGCPALVKWVAKELGINESKLEIWMTNALASSRDIQPFNAYARLRTSAVILRDASGAHIQALTQVINEFASSTAPPTEEQMASIADAIASNAGEDNHYGVAEEYLNALAQYISILNTDLGFSMSEAVEFATANYVNQLAERGNANVAAYVMSRLGEL